MPELTSHIAREPFGHLPDGRAVERLRLCREGGFEARVITYGATLQALMVPDRHGHCDDVVLGHDGLAGYVGARLFFGATVGRYANRIADGRLRLDGVDIRLAANDGPHTLHGGADGFDRQVWEIAETGEGAEPYATLTYVSADGEQGFPGRVEASVTYRLTGPTELAITFLARTDRPTVVNLTNHSYFNLDGAAAGTALDHRLMVDADHFLAIDDGAIPLPGPPRPVAGTPFDFRIAQAIGTRIRNDDPQLRHGHGYDHNFCLGPAGELRLAARLQAPLSGRRLELLTDQPGLQVYSGNYLDGSIAGKSGRLYRQSDAVCLEPQLWPDAPNRADFPSARLAAGETYRHRMLLRFECGAGAT